MALNKETQDLLTESVSLHLDSAWGALQDQLSEGEKPYELLKKIVKLEELRQSLATKNSGE